MPNTREIILTDKQFWFCLEVNPREVTIDMPNTVKTHDLVYGEYVESTKPSAAKMSIATFIPHDASDFKKMGYSQKFIISRMEYWRENDVPVFVYFEDMTKEFRIEGFQKTMREGDRDVHITLNLVECRDIHMQMRKNEYTTYWAARTAIYHTTIPGDTLVKLQGVYGISWQAIYAANRNIIGVNPEALPQGVRLVIP